MLQPTLKEDFLYYVWQTKAFDVLGLETIDGKKIHIKSFGTRNHDAGPDFSECQIEIDGILWAGNVEMHVRTSDWDAHGHDLDLAYANVVLHVVYEHDIDIINAKDRSIQTVEMKQYIHPKVLNHYLSLVGTMVDIPCHALFRSVSPFTKTMWLENVAIQRLERKTKDINVLLEKLAGDWLQVLFVQLSAYLGGRTNKLPFTMLAESIPYTTLLKHQNIEQIEALLFGQAGMLIDGSIEDDYYQRLRKEYVFLAKKYGLTAIPSISWKFSKMRPANFPTIRIAQLAQIIHKEKGFLFDAIVKKGKRTSLDVKTSSYWNTHYSFGKTSAHKEKKLGKSMQDVLMINVVAPLRFAYGKSHLDEELQDAAINTLQHIKPENNRITKKYASIDGCDIQSAWDSQGYIELYTSYCTPKRCMSCRIGHAIMKGDGTI